MYTTLFTTEALKTCTGRGSGLRYIITKGVQLVYHGSFGGQALPKKGSRAMNVPRRQATSVLTKHSMPFSAMLLGQQFSAPPGRLAQSHPSLWGEEGVGSELFGKGAPSLSLAVPLPIVLPCTADAVATDSAVLVQDAVGAQVIGWSWRGRRRHKGDAEDSGAHRRRLVDAGDAEVEAAWEGRAGRERQAGRLAAAGATAEDAAAELPAQRGQAAGPRPGVGREWVRKGRLERGRIRPAEFHTAGAGVDAAEERVEEIHSDVAGARASSNVRRAAARQCGTSRCPEDGIALGVSLGGVDW
mmetsp:Transcript_9049/g.26355  ORF Transcript_9049/g.26355 Transcript_9049/m.26355 type:complete len:300 (+) Transcript_9049:117-1016(+)